MHYWLYCADVLMGILNSGAVSMNKKKKSWLCLECAHSHSPMHAACTLCTLKLYSKSNEKSICRGLA